MDRDLGIAGRVITASKSASSSSSSETTTYVPHLVHLDRPLVRIPTVAIHLDRTQNEKFFYNQESGMQAILGLVSEQVSTPATVVAAIDPSPPDSSPKSPLDTQANHHPRLLELVAEELSAQGIKGASGSSVQVGDIYDFDLSLVDVQPPTLGGANEEFIFSARLDNLFSTFCAVEGLADSLLPPSAASSSSSSSSAENADLPDGSIRVVACWDNEEIGSASAYGAESNFLEAIIQRVVGDPAKFDQSIANSFLISCDMGHALHPAPDHAGKHQAEHRPLMNQGPAVKTNAKVSISSDFTAVKSRRKSACGLTFNLLDSLRIDRTNDVPSPPNRSHRQRAAARVQRAQRHALRLDHRPAVLQARAPHRRHRLRAAGHA